jgi:hypothetical protein
MSIGRFLPFLLVLAGCQSTLTGNEGNLMFSYTADDQVGDFNKPVGVGANLEIRVLSAGTMQPVTLKSVVSSDPSVLAVDSVGATSFVVQGVSDGSVLIEVEGDGPEGPLSDSVNLLAAAPEVVKLYHSCDPVARTASYQTGAQILLPFDLEKANGQAVIGYGLHPIEITPPAGATLDETSKDQANLHLTLGATAGEVTLASAIDDETLTLNVVEAGAIDGASFNFFSTDGTDVIVFEGETRFAHVFPMVGDSRICQATSTMNVTSKTPELCLVSVTENLDDTVSVNESLWVKIEGVAFGECLFDVTFPDGAGGAGSTTELKVSVAKKP